MMTGSKRTLHVAGLLLAALLPASIGSSAALTAPTPTPASGWITAMPCVRPARTTPVSSLIGTPGPVGASVLPPSGKASSGAWQPATISLSDISTGSEASASVASALQETLTEISECAAFPDNGVEAYFSDDFFRRTVVVQRSSATPGSDVGQSDYSWGFAGIGAPGDSPKVTAAWNMADGKVGAIVLTSTPSPRLFIVFVQAPKTGDWLIDEMAYLFDEPTTPTP